MSNTVAQPHRKILWGSCENINNLPDEILQRILCFLPMKEAVATSILSNRWRPPWTQLPVLDFQDLPISNSHEKKRREFVEFVDKTLMFNRFVCLDKFHLSCDIRNHPSHIKKWIDCAIVQEVELDKSVPQTKNSRINIKLPRRFFTIKNLKVLKLNNGILIDIPHGTSVCFPSLKVLHLNLIQYANNESVSTLFRGCTSLEELVVYRSAIDYVEPFSISIPTLKTLKIDGQYRKGNYGWSFARRCDVKIVALNLEYLHIKDLGLEQLECTVFIKLIEAHIYCYRNSPFQLAKVLSNAKILHLDLMYSTSGHIRFTRKDRLPKGLSPSLKKVCWSGFRGIEDELELVEYILKNARTLELVEICSLDLDLSPELKFGILQKLSKFPRCSLTCKSCIQVRKISSNQWLEVLHLLY